MTFEPLKPGPVSSPLTGPVPWKLCEGLSAWESSSAGPPQGLPLRRQSSSAEANRENLGVPYLENMFLPSTIPHPSLNLHFT